MSTYSIAQAKDQLSKLVDEVLEGKNVTITRHGKPVVDLRPSQSEPKPKRSTKEMLEWLRQRREELPQLETNAVDLIRAMRDED